MAKMCRRLKWIVPCVKHEFATCQSIEDNQLILENFHCHMPILYSGQHLDDFIPKDVMNCSHDDTKEGLDFILKKETKCIQTRVATYVADHESLLTQ